MSIESDPASTFNPEKRRPGITKLTEDIMAENPHMPADEAYCLAKERYTDIFDKRKKS